MDEKKPTLSQVINGLIDQMQIQQKRINNLQEIVTAQQRLLTDLCEAAGMKPQKRTLH